MSLQLKVTRKQCKDSCELVTTVSLQTVTTIRRSYNFTTRCLCGCES